MFRFLCALIVLAFTACTAPPRYIYDPPGAVELALSPRDTAAVRQLCIAPDSVIAGTRSCQLRGT